MNHSGIGLLDCTLRDGAYCLDKKFGNAFISGIIRGLVQVGIEFIEVGFFQDEGFGDGKTVFLNSADVMRFIPPDKKKSKFAVLADCSRYSVKNLDERRLDSIDIIRECFFKNEKKKALSNALDMKKKGYDVFIQPVNILGYTDRELLDLMDGVNEISPYCFSIVDTFGSMYHEDLHRIFELVNHNLVPSCRMGFHSHNNMQLSSSLSQEFIRLTSSSGRGSIVDSTLSGMGRGAGNTPTELVVQYMNTHYGAKYNIDALLDMMDVYMDNIRNRCTWGYSTPFFIAGCYSAHINNVTYLTAKNNIRSKDIRAVLSNLEKEERTRYNYKNVEKAYLEQISTDFDDSASLAFLEDKFQNKYILILVPGKTLNSQKDRISEYIKKYNPIIISVNFVPYDTPVDFVYMSNIRRYQLWQNDAKFLHTRKIMTSNIVAGEFCQDAIVVSITRLLRNSKMLHSDNSTILLLRLLAIIHCKDIAFAGFDGFSFGNDENFENYAIEELEVASVRRNPAAINEEIENMLKDFRDEYADNIPSIHFVTESRFERIVNIQH